MPRVQTLTSNFTAGEFSPRLRGRSDIEKFNSSAERLENIVVLRQGGATMRPSMDFKGYAKSSVGLTRAIPFVYSRTDAFVLEFGNSSIRFWRDGVQIESAPLTPVEVTSPYTSTAMIEAIDYTQGGDTLFLFHPDVPTQRLRRFSDTNWVLDAAPFDPAPLYEFGFASSAVTLTLSAATVGAGRTVTASGGDAFQAADVGRRLTCAGGVLTITGYTSLTQVTGTISVAFQGVSLAPSTWRLQGSPLTTCTPSAAGPVGTVITLTLSANGFRAPDGTTGYVEINGGLVKLTNLASNSIADGTIVREMTGIVAAPADAWVLLHPSWNAFDGYPRTGALLQQRLWAAGSPGFPLSFWGSRSGLFFDFTPGTLDDSAVYKTVDSDDNSLIQFLVSGFGGSLLALTYGGEFDVRGGIEKPITQLNAQITKRTNWGSSADCRPCRTGTDVLFIERGGSTIRALRRDIDAGFTADDISIFSDHLLDAGVVGMAYEQKPNSVVWVMTADGDLLSMTYNREQNQVSICSGVVANGSVESIVTIPDGAQDATYVFVRRQINGFSVVLLERLNWSAYPGLDSRARVVSAAADLFSGFSHLEGESVAVLADGVYMGLIEVVAGQIRIPRNADVLEAGLPYSATIRLAAPEVGTGTGTSQAQAMSTHSVSVRFLDTIGGKSNLQDLGFLQFDGPLLDVAPTPFTGVKSVSDAGWADGESIVELVQDLPYPFTVLSVVRGITVNSG